MGRVRVFYGHEGVVPPLGLVAPAAAAPAEDETPIDDAPEVEVEETDDAPEVEVEETDDAPEVEVEEIELPGSRATVAELDAFGEKYGVEFAADANAKEKRAAIQAWADALPTSDDEEK